MYRLTDIPAIMHHPLQFTPRAPRLPTYRHWMSSVRTLPPHPPSQPVELDQRPPRRPRFIPHQTVYHHFLRSLAAAEQRYPLLLFLAGSVIREYSAEDRESVEAGGSGEDGEGVASAGHVDGTSKLRVSVVRVRLSRSREPT